MQDYYFESRDKSLHPNGGNTITPLLTLISPMVAL